jgi:hypothetical protein
MLMACQLPNNKNLFLIEQTLSPIYDLYKKTVNQVGPSNFTHSVFIKGFLEKSSFRKILMLGGSFIHCACRTCHDYSIIKDKSFDFTSVVKDLDEKRLLKNMLEGMKVSSDKIYSWNSFLKDTHDEYDFIFYDTLNSPIDSNTITYVISLLNDRGVIFFSDMQQKRICSQVEEKIFEFDMYTLPLSHVCPPDENGRVIEMALFDQY